MPDIMDGLSQILFNLPNVDSSNFSSQELLILGRHF